MPNSIVSNAKTKLKHLYNFIPYEVLLGKQYRNLYKFLEKSQWWTKEQHEFWQYDQMINLLTHAYKNVPYYTKLFNEWGIRPSSIKELKDIKKIPYLTKEIIQNNLQDLTAINYRKNMMTYVTTGGSTGVPLGFFEHKGDAKIMEWAFMTSQWSRVGYRIDKVNKNVILRGNVTTDNKPYEYIGNNLILSSYELSEKNMELYIKLIHDFKPDFIRAYPSSISILSRYIIENNINIRIATLNAILCGSENMLDYQRNIIEQAFHVRIFSWYGHSEKACLAGECEKSNYYHVFSEYGYTELINENGEEINQDDETGELVVTGFNNYIVPFIRYKTMDYAINSNAKCECGREYKMIKKVIGREQEFVVTKSGNKLPLTAIIFAQHFYAFSKMKILQLEQNEVGKVTVRIVPSRPFNSKDIDEIKEKIIKAANHQLEAEIVFVDDIPRTKHGKHLFLIQNLESMS